MRTLASRVKPESFEPTRARISAPSHQVRALRVRSSSTENTLCSKEVVHPRQTTVHGCPLRAGSQARTTLDRGLRLSGNRSYSNTALHPPHLTADRACVLDCFHGPPSVLRLRASSFRVVVDSELLSSLQLPMQLPRYALR